MSHLVKLIVSVYLSAFKNSNVFLLKKSKNVNVLDFILFS